MRFVNDCTMRRLLACLLLVGLGFSLPAAGGSSCICLATLLRASVETSDCCDDCGGSQQETTPCCVELAELPDAQSPAPMPVIPTMPVFDLGWIASVPPLETADAADPVERFERIRGPTTALSRRAILAVWRL